MNKLRLWTQGGRARLALASASCILLAFALLGPTLSAFAAQGVPTLAPAGASTIGNYVWHDYNSDGSHEAADDPANSVEEEFTAGIANIALERWIWNGATYVLDTTDPSSTPYATTDVTGKYSLGATALGTRYWVKVAASNFLPGGPLYGYVYTGAGTYPEPFTMPPDNFFDYKNADFGFVRGEDWGDLPDPKYATLDVNNGPRHLIITPLRLGATVDTEVNGRPDATTTGDDTTGPLPDDEDGVVMKPGVGGGLWADGAVSAGHGGSLEIVISGGSGLPQVFMDFTGGGLGAVTLRAANGDPLPMVSFAPWVAGTYRVYFDIPTGTMASGPNIPVRVRLSSAGGLAATGAAPNGEVEDYVFSFTPTAVSLASFSAVSGTNLLLIGLVGTSLGAVLIVGQVRGRRAAPQRR